MKTKRNPAQYAQLIFARLLRNADFEVGIITGNVNTIFDGYFSSLIPGQDDGKVSIDSAKLEGMSGFLVVPDNHTFIMDEEEVIRDQEKMDYWVATHHPVNSISTRLFFARPLCDLLLVAGLLSP